MIEIGVGGAAKDPLLTLLVEALAKGTGGKAATDKSLGGFGLVARFPAQEQADRFCDAVRRYLSGAGLTLASPQGEPTLSPPVSSVATESGKEMNEAFQVLQESIQGIREKKGAAIRRAVKAVETLERTTPGNDYSEFVNVLCDIGAVLRANKAIKKSEVQLASEIMVNPRNFEEMKEGLRKLLPAGRSDRPKIVEEKSQIRRRAGV